jgi:hypothetical protein
MLVFLKFYVFVTTILSALYITCHTMLYIYVMGHLEDSYIIEKAGFGI